MSKPNSSLGKSRDFGTGNNGKGDKSRVTNQTAYAEGYEGIDWGKKPINGFSGLAQQAPNPEIGPFENWDR